MRETTSTPALHADLIQPRADPSDPGCAAPTADRLSDRLETHDLLVYN